MKELNLDLDKLPITKAIKNYLEEEIVPFSMPGHKYGKGFLQEDIYKLILNGDITEVEGLDNLHSPEGIIKESENLLTKAYGSESSFFLVNGSTSGNLIMIFSAFNEGDKVIVERNCHRSIMNGIILRKLKPIYVENIIDEKLKCPIAINKKHLASILENNNDIKGIILTYPYYHAVGIDVEETINLCKSKGLIILIDSAHGAHFGFNEKLPKSAQQFNSDIVVMSAHKTLPSLTQTAYIHVNDSDLVEKVKFYKGMFLSTSPSYIFMISLEYGRYFIENFGKDAYDELLSEINFFKNSTKDIKEINIVDKSNFKNYKDVQFDESRILINLVEGYSGHKLLDYLRERKIQCEMSDERNVILIPSPFNDKNDFMKLTEAIKECDFLKLKDKEKGFYESEIPKTIVYPFEAVNREVEDVLFNEANGKVAAENIIPYPPGVPLIVMGELIEDKHLKIIEKYLQDEITILGVNDNKIKIIKDFK